MEVITDLVAKVKAVSVANSMLEEVDLGLRDVILTRMRELEKRMCGSCRRY